MDHNSFQDSPLEGQLSKKLYKRGKLAFPFKSVLSFVPLIDQWKRTAKSGNRLERKDAANLLDLIKDAKPLHQPISDLSVLKTYKDEIELMMSKVFPPGIQDEVLSAAMLPYEIDAFYSTRVLSEKLELTNDTFLRATKLTPERSMVFRTISACMYILKEYYKLDVSEKHPMTLALKDKGMNTLRHYTLDFVGAFSEIKAIGKVKKVTQKHVKELMGDFYNVEKWLEVVPPNKFQFSGFMIINLLDVTYQEIISSLKMDLLDKDAILSKDSISRISDKIKSLLGMQDLRIGMAAFNKDEDAMMNYGNKNWNSIIVSGDKKFSCSADECQRSLYAQTVKTMVPIVVDDLSELEQKTPIEDVILQEGIRSLAIAPLIYDGDLVGIIELASQQPGQLSSGSIIELKEVLPLMSMAIWRVSEELNNKVQATIKEKYTVIHPTVEWKFVQAAFNYLNNSENGVMDIDEIVFKDVYPLYGLSDIRGSSSQRSKAIQEDLIEQLSLAKKALEKGYDFKKMPIIKELIFQINNTMMNIRYGLKSGDEINVLEFIKQEIEPFLENMKDWNSEMSTVYETYRSHLDPDLGVLYKKRKQFEKSLMKINDTIASFLENQQVEAQQMFPHYYQMYKTDGVDYNIYVGQSLVRNKTFNEVYLKNLRLWQFIVMAKIARKADQLKKKLTTPLEIAQLILAQSTPLSIRFRTDEKQFDVDGAYNIRYEIVKKRIDKVKINDSNERLTQPGKIAVVYSHDKEALEYHKYIKYLQSIDLLNSGVEELDLEELQGASGLKALRVSVNLRTSKQEGISQVSAKEEIEKIIEKIEIEA